MGKELKLKEGEGYYIKAVALRHIKPRGEAQQSTFPYLEPIFCITKLNIC